MDKRTISDNSRFFNSIDEVPKEMDNGIKNYYGLERNLFDLAQGKSKWEIIREFSSERLQNQYRKSIQKHKNLTVLYCD